MTSPFGVLWVLKSGNERKITGKVCGSTKKDENFDHNAHFDFTRLSFVELRVTRNPLIYATPIHGLLQSVVYAKIPENVVDDTNQVYKNQTNRFNIINFLIKNIKRYKCKKKIAF